MTSAIEKIVAGHFQMQDRLSAQLRFHDNYRAVLHLFNEQHEGKTYTLDYAVNWMVDNLIKYSGYKLK